jgi:hypothetical protein
MKKLHKTQRSAARVCAICGFIGVDNFKVEKRGFCNFPLAKFSTFEARCEEKMLVKTSQFGGAH